MTTDLLPATRPSPRTLALVLFLVSGCQPDSSGRSPESDATDALDGSTGTIAWTVDSEFRTVCKPSEPCVRSIQVNSVGEISVTDPVGTVDLAPHVDPAIVDRWAAFVRAVEADSCPWERPADYLDTVDLTVTRDGTVVVVETAMGCVDLALDGDHDTLGTLLHDSLEAVQPEIGCPDWVAGPIDFDGMQLLEETPRFACMPRF